MRCKHGGLYPAQIKRRFRLRGTVEAADVGGVKRRAGVPVVHASAQAGGNLPVALRVAAPLQRVAFASQSSRHGPPQASSPNASRDAS